MAVRKSQSWIETFSGWLPRWPVKLIKARDQNDPDVIIKTNDLSVLSAPAKLPTQKRQEKKADSEYGTDSESDAILPIRYSTPKNTVHENQLNTRNDTDLDLVRKRQKKNADKNKSRKMRSINGINDRYEPEHRKNIYMARGDEDYIPKNVKHSRDVNQNAKMANRKYRLNKEILVGSDTSSSESSEEEMRGARYRSQNINRRIRDPKPFNAQTVDWSDYLKHFEVVSNWNRWNDAEKAQQLVMSFEGEALKLLGELPCNITNNYVALLNCRFDPSEQSHAYKIQFRNRHRHPDETVVQFSQALRRLVAKAFPTMQAEAQAS